MVSDCLANGAIYKRNIDGRKFEVLDIGTTRPFAFKRLQELNAMTTLTRPVEEYQDYGKDKNRPERIPLDRNGKPEESTVFPDWVRFLADDDYFVACRWIDSDIPVQPKIGRREIPHPRVYFKPEQIAEIATRIK